MKNLILAAAAIAAISFTTSTAMAGHYRRVVRHHVHVPHVARHHVHHHAYRHVPVYRGGYHAYPVHHGYHHNYHYARPHYSSGGIGVYGGHFSIHIGY